MLGGWLAPSTGAGVGQNLAFLKLSLGITLIQLDLDQDGKHLKKKQAKKTRLVISLVTSFPVSFIFEKEKAGAPGCLSQ